MVLVAQLVAGIGPAGAETLAKRLRVTEVPVTATIDTGRADNIGPFWTFEDLRAVALSPSPNGEAKVAWQDTTGAIHVTPLTAADTRKAPDLVIGTGRLYDLVAHDDGFAVLLAQSTRMYLERYNAAGTRLFRTELTDADDRVDGMHAGKLAWSGSRFAAYFGIHGTSGFSAGHEGDKLKFVDANGAIVSGGWEWGCSHSLDVRLLYDGGEALPMCVSDCYPGLGFYLKNAYLLAAVDGDCAGTTLGRFGQFARVGARLALVYMTIDGRSSWDVAFVAVDRAAPHTVRSQQILASGSGNEINAKVAAYGPDRLLASWEAPGVQRTFVELDGNGAALAPAEQLNVKAGPVDDQRTLANGDILWAYAWNTATSLKIVRIAYRKPQALRPIMMLLEE